MKIKSIYLYLLLSFIFINCSKDKASQEPDKLPSDFFSDNTSTIISDGKSIIDNAIDQAVALNTNIDFEVIVQEIEQLKGVESGTISEKGEAILIRETNGAALNLLIFSKADNRLLIDDSFSGKNSIITTKFPPVIAAPRNEGKALILAPFQYEFGESLDVLKERFEAAGYETDTYVNYQADLDKFRGSFLSQYNIVYISSHGWAEAHSNWQSTFEPGNAMISTGQKFDNGEYVSQLTNSEAEELFHADENYGVSPNWFKVTAKGDFENTWVFINACFSARYESGINSFSETFFDLNAAAFNGFDDLTYSNLSDAIAKKSTGSFTSGVSFFEMEQDVLTDFNLRQIVMRFRNENSSTINPEILTINSFISRQNVTDNYYLIAPENIIGTATINPEYGPEGTPAVFSVEIIDDYAIAVSRIELDIDNTNQFGLSLTQVSNNRWERSDLTAPDGVFPRIDTFSFTAYDASDTIIAQGSAAFSFSRASTGDRFSKNSRRKWSK